MVAAVAGCDLMLFDIVIHSQSQTYTGACGCDLMLFDIVIHYLRSIVILRRCCDLMLFDIVIHSTANNRDIATVVI